MEAENVNQSINTPPAISETPLPPSPKSKMKKVSLLIGIVLLLLTVCIGGYYVLNKNNKAVQPNNQQSVVVSPTESPQINSEALPNLAYIETTGIAVPEDKNPDLGGVFVVNPANSDKKLLYKFNRASLINAYGFPMYSPVTHEILKYSSEGAIAVNTDTGPTRNVYKAKPNSSFNFKMSGDYKSIYISENSTDAQGMATGKTNKYIVLLSGNNEPKQVDSFPVDSQPYFDNRTGKSIEVKVKDSTVGGAGTFINSSEIIVTDTKTNTKKTFVYNKPGEIEPLFTANNYFYFKVNQCCASTDRLGSMTQLNLETGEFSTPLTLSELHKRLTNKDFTLENKGISPDGVYYVYSVVNNSVPNNGDVKTYLYNTDTKQETELKVGIDSFINWSTDSHYLLFNYDEPGSYMYSIGSQKLEQIKIPSSTNYVILK